jgi:hypothetical protein
MSFFKNKRQEGKTGPVWGFVPMTGRGYRDGVKEGNMVEILCTHVKMEK